MVARALRPLRAGTMARLRTTFSIEAITMLFETSLTPLPVFGLRREMNRLFDDVLTRSTPAAAWTPPVDVREDENEITLSIELPGVKPENVEVTSDNGMLTVRGQKSAERKEGSENEYQLVERSYGTFTRSFRLPKGIDDSKIEAHFDNGVLDIRVPKAALPQPKKIAIGTGNGQNDKAAKVQGQASNAKQDHDSARSVPVDTK
jgi:HSP20 family protein